MSRPLLASLIIVVAAGCGNDDEGPGAGGSTGKGGTAGSSTGGKGASGGKAGTGGTGGGTVGNGGSSAGGGGGSGGSEDASAGSGGTAGASAAGGASGSGGNAGAIGASGTAGSGGTGGAVGTGGAAGTGGTGGTAACAGPTCGTAPHQLFNIQSFIVPIPVADAGTPPDVTVTASICNTSVQVPNGLQAQMCVQKDVAFYFTGTQTGYLTALTSEYKISLSFPDFPLLAVPWMFPPGVPLNHDPAWDPAKKAFIRTFVGRAKSGSTAPCDTRAGVTFAVTGHPEAVVKYGGGGTSTGTSVGDAAGFITIETTGTLAAPEFVTVTATKAGCTLSRDPTAFLIYTLRSPVARGVATTDWGWENGN